MHQTTETQRVWTLSTKHICYSLSDISVTVRPVSQSQFSQDEKSQDELQWACRAPKVCGTIQWYNNHCHFIWCLYFQQQFYGPPSLPLSLNNFSPYLLLFPLLFLKKKNPCTFLFHILHSFAFFLHIFYLDGKMIWLLKYLFLYLTKLGILISFKSYKDLMFLSPFFLRSHFSI